MTAGGTGEALNGSAAVDETAEPLPEDVLKERLAAEADAHVAAAESRVAKAEAALEGAKQSLANATAEREGL